MSRIQNPHRKKEVTDSVCAQHITVRRRGAFISTHVYLRWNAAGVVKSELQANL